MLSHSRSDGEFPIHKQGISVGWREMVDVVWGSHHKVVVCCGDGGVGGLDTNVNVFMYIEGQLPSSRFSCLLFLVRRKVSKQTKDKATMIQSAHIYVYRV